jgi:hypothetical protein
LLAPDHQLRAEGLRLQGQALHQGAALQGGAVASQAPQVFRFGLADDRRSGHGLRVRLLPIAL